VLVLYLIYYLTKTDNDVKINKDWNELKNMPSFWLTIIFGLSILFGFGVFGIIAFIISGSILVSKLV
jgi:hypothetical protein